MSKPIYGVKYTGSLPEESLTIHIDGDEYVLDVKTLTSNYRCIYGQGCGGTTPHSGEGPTKHRPTDNSVTGCCRTGVIYGHATTEVSPGNEGEADSPLRTQPFVDALLPEEAQHYDQIQEGWYRERQNSGGSWTSQHLTVKGNCIFLNTEMANGNTGCALYHAAQRLGVPPQEARPFACHTVPADSFHLGESTDGAGERYLVTLRPHWYGWFHPDGWFCTKEPEAFTGTVPAYEHMESEFTLLLGTEVYAGIRKALDQVMEERGARIKESWGTPVFLPMPKWARKAETERGAERERVETELGPELFEEL